MLLSLVVELLKVLLDKCDELVDVPWCIGMMGIFNVVEEYQFQDIKVWDVGGLTDQLDVQTCGVGCGNEGGVVRFDVDRVIVLL